MKNKQTISQKPNANFFVKTSTHFHRINVEDILWIEALGNYVIIHTPERKYTVHTTMKGIEKKLIPEFFIRVHRSFIVALDKINSVNGKTLKVASKYIPVSNSYKENLMQNLNLL